MCQVYRAEIKLPEWISDYQKLTGVNARDSTGASPAVTRRCRLNHQNGNKCVV